MPKLRSGASRLKYYFLIPLLLLLVPSAYAQNYRFDSTAMSATGKPLVNATITVCTSAAPANQVPCTPLANIFRDAAGTVPQANPFTTAGLGNFGFYAPPNSYFYTISGSGVTPSGPFPLTLPCVINTSCGGAALPSVTVPFTATPIFSGTTSQNFEMILTGNVTSSTISGSPSNGSLMAFHICQDGTGGRTFVWPVSFLTPPAIQSGASLCTDTAFKLDAGGVWTPLQQPASGGGGSPAGAVNTLQTNAGAGIFGTSGASDDGTNFNIDRDVHPKGPNPYIDLSRYGLYQGSGAPITCSATAASAVLTCPGGTGDFAVGQGIEIPLAGPAPTFDPWGTTMIDNYSRSGNVATYHVVSTFVGPPQTITITGLTDASFNVTGATITGSDQSNHFTVANTGANVSTTAGSGVGTLTSANVVVTPSGILNGSTTYAYKVVMRDYNGALSAASPAGTTTTGAATLGNNVIPVTSCARTAGIVTCTTTAPHNLQANIPVSLSGTSYGLYDGQHQIASVPTSTTFTYTAYGKGDDANPPTGGNVNVTAKNTVRWNMHPNQQLQALIYRSINGGAYSLVGITEGMDGAFVDWGISTLPGGQYLAPQASYISTTTPTATTVNGILAGRITAINGNNITLDTAAAATATSQPAAHDNAPIIVAGCVALGVGTNGGNLYIPNGGNVVFNSILNMRDKCTWPNPDKMKILVNSSKLLVNEPIVLRLVHNDWESIGGGGNAASFAVGQPSSEVTGNAYPYFYNPAGNGPTYFKNFLMSAYRGYQSGIVEDQGVSTGTANTEYDNIDIGGYSGSMPVILRGGAFQHRFERGVISTGNDYAAPEPLLITIPNALGSSWGSLGGDQTFDQTTFIGKGVLYETWGITAQQVGYTTFTDNLMESGVAPMIRFNLAGTNSAVQGITMRNPSYSDSIFNATPMIELGGNGTGFYSFRVLNPQCGGPLFAGGGGDINILGVCDPVGASQYKLDGYGGTAGSLYTGANIGINGGYFYTQMARPAAPTLATSTTGGSVTNGPHQYAIIAVDALNNPTLFGPPVLITTTGSNTSTVTVTPPTLPAGAVGYRVLRFDDADLYHFYGTTVLCAQLTTPINGPFVDTIANGTECGDTETQVSLAATSILSSTGVYGPSFDLLSSAPSTPPASLGRLTWQSNVLTCTNPNSSSCMPLPIAINLAASGPGGVTGFLPVANICTAAGASSATVLFGDCTWRTPAGSGTLTDTSGAATLNGVMIGNGTTDLKAIAVDSNVTHVLHATAGAPVMSSIVSADLPLINLASSSAGGVTGLLPIANNCPGTTGASSSTYLRGDCTWNTPTGAGTVTNTAGNLTLNQLIVGNAIADVKVGNLTGDCTTSGSTATTCSQVNGNPILHRAFIPIGNNANGTAALAWNTTLTPTAVTGTNVVEAVLPFADASTAQLPAIMLPPDWTGAIDVSVVFYDPSTSGTVIFNIAGMCGSVNGSATDDQTFNGVQAMNTITLSTPANAQWIANKTNITTSGCSATNPLVLKLTRATDTAVGVANVKGLFVTYRSTNAI